MAKACELSRKNKKLRFAVFKSNMHLYVQIIDDFKGSTLVSASTVEFKESSTITRANIANAELLGKIIGERAVKAKITENIMFDRRRYKYIGVVKAIADNARKAGLKF